MISEWQRSKWNNCPCWQCKERTEACHGKCERYGEWFARIQKAKEAERKDNVETISDSALRKIWRRQRWQSKQPVSRPDKDR